MTRVLALTAGLLSALLPSALSAGDGVEFMPFFGYRFGGSFDEDISGRNLDLEDDGNWGFAISKPASSTTRYELLYSHQETRLSDRPIPRTLSISISTISTWAVRWMSAMSALFPISAAASA